MKRITVSKLMWCTACTLCCCVLNTYGQNWNTENTDTLNANATDDIWRSGRVLISNSYRYILNSGLGVVNKYGADNNRAGYFSLNETDNWFNTDGDSTRVGLATSTASTYTTLVASNYANFGSEAINTDVHNSTAEFLYNRGMPDNLGYRDAGRLTKAAVLKLSGSFGNNARSHATGQFDLLNMRVFTSSDSNNLAQVDNFCAIRLENFRGVNAGIIKNGWGIYMQPEILKNYFAGNTAIGTTAATHKLTVSATTDPVRLLGLQNNVTDSGILSIDDEGVVHKIDRASFTAGLEAAGASVKFTSVTGDTILSDDIELYLHSGGNAAYSLPPPATRKGKVWKIVNTGSGTITFSESYFEGYKTRKTLMNVPGNYTITLFSDGTRYIAL